MRTPSFMKNLLFISTLLCIAGLSAFAQPEGKPDFKVLKEVYKKAKKEGDPTASLQIAQKSIGGLYTADAYRSFAEAETWLKQVHGKLEAGKAAS